ncbi:MAG: hypothetical protein ACRD4K_03620, partial [Candidatus Acidiferrales bacterium]
IIVPIRGLIRGENKLGHNVEPQASGPLKILYSNTGHILASRIAYRAVPVENAPAHSKGELR